VLWLRFYHYRLSETSLITHTVSGFTLTHSLPLVVPRLSLLHLPRTIDRLYRNQLHLDDDRVYVDRVYLHHVTDYCPCVRVTSLVEHGRTHDLLGDSVRVTVGRRASVLHVAEAVLADAARDAHRRAAVSDTRREVVNVARLVTSRQTALVVATSARVVRADVSVVMVTQLLDRFLNQTDTNIHPAVLYIVDLRRDVERPR